MLCHFQCVLRGKPRKLFSFFSYRFRGVESLISVTQFQVKWLILAQLLHRGSCLIIVIHNHCHRLNYASITDMENILCNIQVALSEFLYDKLGVRYTPFENDALPACCISSVKDLFCTNINLLGTLVQFLLDFSNPNLHRCSFLICLKTNITFWLTHLRHYMKIRGLLNKCTYLQKSLFHYFVIHPESTYPFSA